MKLLQINKFAQFIHSENLIQIVDYHPKHQNRQHFICIGKPILCLPPKQKDLKLSLHEKKGDDTILHPKILLRRFPVNSMFMRVVGRPLPHRQFIGKNFMERLSKKILISNCSSHTNFSNTALIISETKQGKWQNLLSDLLVNVSEIKTLFVESYDLDDTMIDRLQFVCSTKIGNKGNEKWVIIEDDDIHLNTKSIRRHKDIFLPSSALSIENLDVKVCNMIGDEVEEDSSCDSTYMLSVMDRVGTTIRLSYHWINLS